jgi:2-methylcitrate dehydratase
MLHLPWEQIQHAIGISASVSAYFGVVAAGKLTMMKNTASPMGTESGVLAALKASEGYTGPEHIIDGKEGLVHVFGPEWKLNLLTDGLGQSWRITQCGMKFFPAEALTHAPISATLDLIKEHDLKPDFSPVRTKPLGCWALSRFLASALYCPTTQPEVIF